MFPFDFGFIPSTLGEDGDPLDILVLMDAPAHVGCLMDVRIIGIITAKQTDDGKKASNDRLLGVAIHSYNHEDLDKIEDVSETLLSQLEEFFVSYNKQRGKKFKVTDGRPSKGAPFSSEWHPRSQRRQKEIRKTDTPTATKLQLSMAPCPSKNTDANEISPKHRNRNRPSFARTGKICATSSRSTTRRGCTTISASN